MDAVRREEGDVGEVVGEIREEEGSIYREEWAVCEEMYRLGIQAGTVA